MPRVAVVGGGLADAGCEVTLLERRRRLGGLTWSYDRDGMMVDNGQHVFLRCCRAYLEWLDRIGSAGDVELQDRLDVTVLRPPSPGQASTDRPTAARLRRSALPAPLHLAQALLGYRHLGVADRLRIGQAAVPLRALDPEDPALDDEAFGSWLARHGQSRRAIDILWDLITVSTVNLRADEASLAMGARVAQALVLTDATGGDLGWSRIPLGVLHGERAGDALAKAGVAVRCGTRVTGITAGAGTGTGPGGVRIDTDAGPLDADAVVVALPHTEVAAVLPPVATAGIGPVADLGLSPIVDVHLTFDRKVTDKAVFAAVDSPVQWVFDRTESSGLAAGGDGRQYLAVSLSAAEEHLGTRPADLAEELAGALRRLLPAARSARLVDSFVTKERTATFRATPGSGRLRPAARTAAPGVYLAGAWTDTGWPATMEGALRSGRRAARAALVGAGITRSLPQEVA